MLRDEISEYPYTGTVFRVVQGKGKEKDTTSVIYDGKMDLYLATEQIGRTLQTADYMVSMPLTKDASGQYIAPFKGDRISLNRYGETIQFEVTNAEPSQLSGITVYVARSSWKQVQ